MLRLIFAATLGGAVGALVLWLFQGHSIKLVPASMSYADLAATMLGAAGLLLAALGLVIGVFALWGYSQFRKMVETSAIDHVTQSVAEGDLKELVTKSSVDYIKAELDTGGLRKIFEDRLDEIMVRGPAARASEESQEDTSFDEEAQ